MTDLGPWARKNLVTLRVFAPVLVLTGVAGFVVPPELSLMSGAAPYNVFHLVAGAVGLAVALARRPVWVSGYVAVFGAIDLYQAVAGLAGFFPAALFAYRTADHVLHVLIGGALLFLGVAGLRESRAARA